MHYWSLLTRHNKAVKLLIEVVTNRAFSKWDPWWNRSWISESRLPSWLNQSKQIRPQATKHPSRTYSLISIHRQKIHQCKCSSQIYAIRFIHFYCPQLGTTMYTQVVDHNIKNSRMLVCLSKNRIDTDLKSFLTISSSQIFCWNNVLWPIIVQA